MPDHHRRACISRVGTLPQTPGPHQPNVNAQDRFRWTIGEILSSPRTLSRTLIGSESPGLRHLAYDVTLQRPTNRRDPSVRVRVRAGNQPTQPYSYTYSYTQLFSMTSRVRHPIRSTTTATTTDYGESEGPIVHRSRRRSRIPLSPQKSPLSCVRGAAARRTRP